MCFAFDCLSCASASTSLSCGWCAKTGVCTAGTAAGPANNATCGVNGWGFQGAACTLQAQCNTQNGAGCTTCVQGGSGVCGYCVSTGRCETGNSTAAADGDCSASQWSFSVATCPAVYDPCNAYSGTCGKCESAPANLKCGFCTQTDKCISGNVNGPTAAGATCRSIYWNFQSCPTDYLCASQSECGSCQVQTAWSDDTNNNNNNNNRAEETLQRARPCLEAHRAMLIGCDLCTLCFFFVCLFVVPFSQHLVQVLEPVHARHDGPDPRPDVQQLRDA